MTFARHFATFTGPYVTIWHTIAYAVQSCYKVAFLTLAWPVSRPGSVNEGRLRGQASPGRRFWWAEPTRLRTGFDHTEDLATVLLRSNLSATYIRTDAVIFFTGLW